MQTFRLQGKSGAFLHRYLHHTLIQFQSLHYQLVLRPRSCHLTPHFLVEQDGDSITYPAHVARRAPLQRYEYPIIPFLYKADRHINLCFVFTANDYNGFVPNQATIGHPSVKGAFSGRRETRQIRTP